MSIYAGYKYCILNSIIHKTEFTSLRMVLREGDTAKSIPDY